MTATNCLSTARKLALTTYSATRRLTEVKRRLGKKVGSKLTTALRSVMTAEEKEFQAEA